MDYGKLNIHVVSDNSGFPIPDATVQITSENEPENIIEEAVTNNVGQLNDIELAAPPVDYSMTPSANKPYSEYTITISASGAITRQKYRKVKSKRWKKPEKLY